MQKNLSLVFKFTRFVTSQELLALFRQFKTLKFVYMLLTDLHKICYQHAALRISSPFFVWLLQPLNLRALYSGKNLRSMQI